MLVNIKTSWYQTSKHHGKPWYFSEPPGGEGSGIMLQWFHSYLSHKMIIGGCCSTPWSLPYAIPEGPILYTMLFNI